MPDPRFQIGDRLRTVRVIPLTQSCDDIGDELYEDMVKDLGKEFEVNEVNCRQDRFFYDVKDGNGLYYWEQELEFA